MLFGTVNSKMEIRLSVSETITKSGLYEVTTIEEGIVNGGESSKR